jgi:hypothetical protein
MITLNLGAVALWWQRQRARLQQQPKPEPPAYIDLDESSRRYAIREAARQQAIDAQCEIRRTSSRCRAAERRRVTAIVERGRL